MKSTLNTQRFKRTRFPSCSHRRDYPEREKFQKYSMLLLTKRKPKTETSSDLAISRQETELDKEFREELPMRISRPLSRLRRGHHHALSQQILAEREEIQALDQWVPGKTLLTQTKSEYISKVREKIDNKLKAEGENPLRDDWIRKSPILLQAVQVLDNFQKQQGQISTSSLRGIDKKISICIPKNLPRPSEDRRTSQFSCVGLQNLRSPRIKQIIGHVYNNHESISNGLKGKLLPPLSSPIDSGDRQIILNNEIILEITRLLIQEKIERKKTKLRKYIKDNTTRLNELGSEDEVLRKLSSDYKLCQDQLFTTQKITMAETNAISIERYHREKAMAQQKEKVSQLKSLFRQHQKNMEIIKVSLLELKQELGQIKLQQLNYYSNLLSEGKEHRTEGLVWIIKAIWFLGFNVPLLKFPKFLDEKAVEFLFKYARKDMEISNVRQSLRGKITANNKLLSSTRPASQIDYSALSNPISEKGDEIKELELCFRNLKEEQRTLRQNEMSRISKEYIENHYEQRFEISQKFLIEALVGGEYSKSEFEKQKKEKEDYLTYQRNLSTYHFGKSAQHRVKLHLRVPSTKY